MAESKSPKAPRTPAEEILLWSGVVAQLNRTRANRLLKDAPLPYPLFVLLRHFSHNPEREWTVTQLTAAFETGQPGMTKKVKKLLQLGLLDTRADQVDGRKRWYRINAAGLTVKDQAMALLRKDQQAIFATWSKSELQQFRNFMLRLKDHMDDHRLD